MISNSGTSTLGLYDLKRQIDAFGGVDYFRPTLAGGYIPNARVMLTNGEIAQNKTSGNLTNDPNADMTGWVKKGNLIEVESVSEMLAISSPQTGMMVTTKSYHTDLNKGGKSYIYDATKSAINDGGLVVNGWVCVNYDYITPEMFGAKGDGVTDDYEALTKCFTSLTPLPSTIYDSNFQQQTSVSTTFLIDSVVYRHTQPLRMPAMANVICKGVITYFLEPQIVSRNNRPCFFYDGADLEVAAIYLPIYINNGDGTWALNNDSTYIANAGDANERSMSVGTKFRFNVITKRNTKIGVNLFGHESGEAELGVGTLGTWASDQTAAAVMQSQDYNYDDLSPRCGVYVSRAWNGKLTRPRIIAHKTGVYLGRHAAGYVVDEPYINRQLDKHTDALGLQSEFLPVGIPPSNNATCGIVMSEFNGTLNSPITEHWGVPYMISGTGVQLNKPHIEGSNLIMNHNFIVYQSKVTVNDWSGIRSMYERAGTSVVYSNGMSLARGDFFDLKGAGYYADNSGFVLVDGSGFDVNYNGYFLNIENIPHDKLIGIAWFTDSRYIHKVQFASANKYTLYVDETKTGAKKGFGVGAATALQNLSYLDEAIRLLGENWSGAIDLNSNLNLTSDMGISSNVTTVVNMNNKTIHANGGSFLLNGDISILFLGTGTLKATSTNLFKNSEYAKRKTQIQTLDGVSFDTTNYLYQLSASPFVDFTLNVQNSNLTSAVGKYANIGNALGSVDIFVKSSTRNTAYDISPVDNAGNSIVQSKFLN